MSIHEPAGFKQLATGWKVKDVDFNDQQIVTNICSIAPHSLIIWSKGERKGAHAESLSGVQLDFDDGISLEVVHDQLERFGYRYILYPSRHHQLEKNGHVVDRFHVLIPFAQPMPIHERARLPKQLKQWALGHFHGFDPAVFDLARCFMPGREPVFTGGSHFLSADELPQVDARETNPGSPLMRYSALQEVRLASGDSALAGSLSGHHAIHCPFHQDKHASAFINDDGKGHQWIHCSTCNTTWHLDSQSLAMLKTDAGADRLAHQVLRSVADRLEFWHDPLGTPYATHRGEASIDHWPVLSSSLQDHLRIHFRKVTGRPVSRTTLQTSLETFAAEAVLQGECHEVFTRVASVNGDLVVNLADGRGSILGIRPNAINVERGTSARFHRQQGTLPLPAPEFPGRLELLWDYVNVSSREDRLLIAGWLLAALRPAGPFPLLVLMGEAGSAKSTAQLILRSLVDPCRATQRALPRNEQDLVIAARNNWILSFDNVSHLPGWLSDALCRLSTGGGLGTRRLYSNDEEQIFDVSRPVLMTGITPFIKRQDLLDRSIIITLDRIEDAQRRSMHDLFVSWERDRPKVLGGLVEACRLALANLPTVKVAHGSRMMDFVSWGTAAERALGATFDGEFSHAFRRNQRDSVAELSQGDDLVARISELVETAGMWVGTFKELLQEIHPKESHAAHPDWPATERKLSHWLTQEAPGLRKLGINYARLGKNSTGYRIRLSKPNDGLQADDEG